MSEKAKKYEVRRVSIDKMNPAPYNPRIDLKPTDPEYQHIKNSVERFGYLEPIVWNERTGNIVSGHQRFKIIVEQGATEIDVCVVDFDEEREKACNLAMNKAVGLWDEDKMNSLLAELTDLDWDMTDFGFEMTTLEDIEDNELKEKDDEAEKLINDAWRTHCHEFAEQFDLLNGFSGMTKSLAKIRFLEAKYYNKPYPRNCSVIFQPHQFKTSGDTSENGSAYEGLIDVYEGKTNPERIRFVTGDNINSLYNGSIAFSGHKMPLDFPVELVRTILKRYASDRPNVLDPCHGWGGRLVGCMLEDVRSYTGVDPSEPANKGLHDIYDTFKQFSNIENVNIISSPFEKADIKENYYDIAFTSPPYFDTEKYIGGEQSRDTYGNYDLWRDGFYKTLIDKTFKALKHDSRFCLQVGSQRYPLLQDAKKIATEVGFEIESVFATDMTNNFNKTKKEDGEVVVVLYKR